MRNKMVSGQGSGIRRTAVLALLIFCWQWPVFAQAQAKTEADTDFSLFEDIESTVSRISTSNQPNQGPGAVKAEPEFTLVGTSRIGSKYSAIVRHKDGETVLVKADASGNTPIAAHDGYAIVSVATGIVSISFPDNKPCVEFSERGVRCNSAGDIAELVLANEEPLASTNPSSQADEENTSSDAADNTNDVAPTNPFAAASDAAAAQERNRNGNRFRPRRIDPGDVPDGMRIVSTPFGDRLVEQ